MPRLSLLQVLSLVIAIGGSSAELDHTKAPPNLTEIEDTNLYWTWRSKAHILPLSGTLQDPCMHYTDPDTGSFHVNFLLNKSPNGASGTKTDDLVSFLSAFNLMEACPCVFEARDNIYFI